jgi:hypothetical protein
MCQAALRHMIMAERWLSDASKGDTAGKRPRSYTPNDSREAVNSGGRPAGAPPQACGGTKPDERLRGQNPLRARSALEAPRWYQECSQRDGADEEANKGGQLAAVHGAATCAPRRGRCPVTITSSRLARSRIPPRSCHRMPGTRTDRDAARGRIIADVALRRGRRREQPVVDT